MIEWLARKERIRSIAERVMTPIENQLIKAKVKPHYMCALSVIAALLAAAFFYTAFIDRMYSEFFFVGAMLILLSGIFDMFNVTLDIRRTPPGLKGDAAYELLHSICDRAVDIILVFGAVASGMVTPGLGMVGIAMMFLKEFVGAKIEALDIMRIRFRVFDRADMFVIMAILFGASYFDTVFVKYGDVAIALVSLLSAVAAMSYLETCLRHEHKMD